MIVIEKNQGTKIDYDVQNTATKKKISFDDDLTINLAKRQEDWEVHIDICYDQMHELVIGAAAGRAYVAELDLPKREYTEEADPDDPEQTILVPKPLDMDKVVLSLWSID